MLSGTAQSTAGHLCGRLGNGERSKSGRLPTLEPACKSSPAVRLGRRGSLDSNWDSAVCSSSRTHAETEATREPVREADAQYALLDSHIRGPSTTEWLRNVLPSQKSLLRHTTSLYSHLDFGILEAVKTKPAPNPTPLVQRPPPDPKKREDFYANVGEAIRVLRSEIPTLFQKDLTYGIYREDIVFRDPKNCFRGMKDYQTIFWSLRFHGQLFFKMLYVDVLRIWESPNKPTDAGTILKMRWSVHGIPRVPWDAEGVFDGISTFKLDSNGKIYEHEVNNVILRDPPKQGNPFLAGLNLIPLPQEQQRIPCPGAWFRAAEKHPEEMNGAQ